MRCVVVGFSGGVTSAWCAGWALRKYHRGEITLLFHDTKEEDQDTYRFLPEMAAALGMPITERSDGRSVTELFREEGFLGNNQNTMCSRVLKAAQSARYTRELRELHGTWSDIETRQERTRDGEPFEILKVVGYSAKEPLRVMRMVARCAEEGVRPVFPLIEERVSKQTCVDWVLAQGVRPSSMYCWAEHANCIGCVKGGRNYFIAVAENHPEVFQQRVALEEEFGHTIIRGGDREEVWLKDLVQLGVKRKVGFREKIDIGACDCGD